MIKLNRNFTPIKLTPEFVKEKTKEYVTDGKAVWNLSWLKESLLNLSYGKCAYCESKLTVESKYMEVEHFVDKKNNPTKVLDWNNLLPSCKRCNGAKSTHDVLAEPIINPFIDNPVNEMYFRLYRFHGFTEKGRATIDVVNLNHLERAVNVRFEIGCGLEELLDKIFSDIEEFEIRPSTQRRNKILNSVEEMYKECLPDSNYSATCATILMSSQVYQNIKQKLIRLNMWSSNFDSFEFIISNNAYLMK